MSNTLPFLQGLVKRAACTILSQPCPMPLFGGARSPFLSPSSESEQLRQAVRFFREFSVFGGIECESERFQEKSETFRENVLGTSAQKV